MDEVFGVLLGFAFAAGIAVERLPIGADEFAEGIDGRRFRSAGRIDDERPAGGGEKGGWWVGWHRQGSTTRFGRACYGKRIRNENSVSLRLRFAMVSRNRHAELQVKWFNGNRGLVAAMALFFAVASVVAWNAPSRRVGVDGLIGERPGTFFGVLIYLMLVGAIAKLLFLRSSRNPQVRWRKLMGLLLGVTLSSIALDIYQSCFLGMSYTSWWKNLVMLFPGVFVRRWAFHELLPLFGIDVFSGSLSFVEMAGIVVLCGMSMCGLVWMAGELLMAKVRIHRASNSELDAGIDPGTSGGG